MNSVGSAPQTSAPTSTGVISETARAKINLTLRIHGRRPDGYHELESLVAFAKVGDVVILTQDSAFTLTVTGPYATAIDGENLIERAADLVATAAPAARLGHCQLDKRLPIASGIGGGSADAAAYLRAVARLNPGLDPDWPRLALKLGADVPVCLASQPVLMAGIGEQLTPCPTLPSLALVLIRPDVAVPPTKTRDVFRNLAAPPLRSPARRCHDLNTARDVDSIAALITAIGNDLASPARALWPVLHDVDQAIAGTSDCLASSLSGAGPTTFALYPTQAAAETAASAIASAYPTWWVAATTT